MNRTVKILLIVLALGLAAWFIWGYFKKSKLDVAVSKLDSALMVLEKTQSRVDSSRAEIKDLQQQLMDYQGFVSQISTDVQRLGIQTQRRQEVFNRTVLNFDREYKERQQTLEETMRGFWPEIRIDTSRNP